MSRDFNNVGSLGTLASASSLGRWSPGQPGSGLRGEQGSRRGESVKRNRLLGKELLGKVVQKACFKVSTTRTGLNANGKDISD